MLGLTNLCAKITTFGTMEKNFKEILETIEAFVFDVDGVFTDGSITIHPDGDFSRRYNVKDGLAVVHAVSKGYPIAIISGGKGSELQKRMESLGIKHIYLNRQTKVEALEDFSRVSGVALDRMIYTGDDYPDIAPMSMVRLGVAPADGAYAVQEQAHYTSAYEGGKGCVRDVIEQVLRARGDWFE